MQRRWVSWNVRGMGRAEKRRSIIVAVRNLKPEIALIQETKLGSDRIKTLESFAKAVRMDSEFTMESCYFHYGISNKK